MTLVSTGMLRLNALKERHSRESGRPARPLFAAVEFARNASERVVPGHQHVCESWIHALAGVTVLEAGRAA
jgi:hypothetical protein